jgi:hypothetical protein
MRYERKTRVKYTAENCKPVYDKNGDIVMDRELFDLLCEEHNCLWGIENKIEQGTLIERPPIKKGDSIWIVCRYRQGSSSVGSYYTRKVVRRCVDKIFLNNDNSFTISTLLIEKGVKHRSIVQSNTFMQTWFLTREEAEKRLKELQE